MCSLSCSVRSTPSGSDRCDVGVHHDSFALDPDGSNPTKDFFAGYEHFPMFPFGKRTDYFDFDASASHPGVISDLDGGEMDTHGIVRVQSRPSSCEFESRPVVMFPSNPEWESAPDLTARVWVRLTRAGSAAGVTLRIQNRGEQFYAVMLRAASPPKGALLGLSKDESAESILGGRSNGAGGIEAYRSVEDTSSRKNPALVGITPVAPTRYPLMVSEGDNDDNALYDAAASAVSTSGPTNATSASRFVPQLGKWYLLEVTQLQRLRPDEAGMPSAGGYRVSVFDAKTLAQSGKASYVVAQAGYAAANSSGLLVSATVSDDGQSTAGADLASGVSGAAVEGAAEIARFETTAPCKGGTTCDGTHDKAFCRFGCQPGFTISGDATQRCWQG